jgi:hypothetical protein
MLRKSNLSKPVMVVVLVLASFVLTMLLSTQTVSGRSSDDPAGPIARGAGTTIIHGGTGSPGFLPVITTVAFHAERSDGGTTGEFDCLAFAPEAATGSHSGQLTVNAMYVVGKITGANVPCADSHVFSPLPLSPPLISLDVVYSHHGPHGSVRRHEQ